MFIECKPMIILYWVVVFMIKDKRLTLLEFVVVKQREK